MFLNLCEIRRRLIWNRCYRFDVNIHGRDEQNSNTNLLEPGEVEMLPHSTSQELKEQANRIPAFLKTAGVGSFNEFFNTYWGLASKSAAVFLWDRPDLAHDAAINALIRLVEHPPAASVHNVRGYIFTCVRRECGRARKEHDNGAFENVVEVASSVDNPERQAELNDEFAQVQAVINSFNQVWQLIIHCRYSKGLSVKETSERLDLPEGTVQSGLSRALKRLRARMLRLDEEEGESNDGTK